VHAAQPEREELQCEGLGQDDCSAYE
jgi:hypothetical protein